MNTGFFLRFDTLPQIQVDQILVGYVGIFSQHFEILHGFLIETNGNLGLQFFR